MATPRKMPETPPTELLFPIRGLDHSTEYDRPQPLTTRVATNVRPFDADEQRLRGGSRPGLTPYLEQIPEGDELIQHLACFTDPTHEALIRIGRKPRPEINLPDLPDFPEIVLDDSVVFEDEVYDLSTFIATHTEYTTLTDSGQTIIVPVGGSGRTIPNQRRPLLIIQPNNISKASGTTYTFTGSEFSATGLAGGDSLTSVDLVSDGAPQSATRGRYSIRVRKRNGFPAVTGVTSTGLPLFRKYRIVPRTGILTVGPGFVQNAFAAYDASTNPKAHDVLTVVSGDLLVAALTTFDAAPSASPTDTQGNTYTLLDAQTNTDGVTGKTFQVRVYYAFASASGDNTISWGSVSADSRLLMFEFSGIDSGSPVVDSNTATGTGTTWDVSLNVTDPGTVAVAIFSQSKDGANFAVTPGTGYTYPGELTGNGALYPIYALNLDAPTTASVIAPESTNWAAVGGTFKPA